MYSSKFVNGSESCVIPLGLPREKKLKSASGFVEHPLHAKTDRRAGRLQKTDAKSTPVPLIGPDPLYFYFDHALT
jgi:hypothetical protein